MGAHPRTVLAATAIVLAALATANWLLYALDPNSASGVAAVVAMLAAGFLLLIRLSTRDRN